MAPPPPDPSGVAEAGPLLAHRRSGWLLAQWRPGPTGLAYHPASLRSASRRARHGFAGQALAATKPI
jgi:hypothetical protein